MCSNLDDIGDEDKYMERVPAVTPLKNCLKCATENTSILLRAKDSYCVSCFEAAIDHKFRACLGKSKLIRHNDNVLLVHNGGANTSTMLQIINNSLNGELHKKFNFNCSVIYLDYGAILKQTLQERKTIAENVLEQVKRYPFPGYISSISLSGYLTENLVDRLDNYEEYLDRVDDTPIRCLLQGPLSAKQDLVNTLQRKLLLTIAKKLSCKFIFYPDTASDIAAKTLAGFALGRGNHITNEVGFIDSRDPEVTILRPMRDFSTEEVTIFCEINSLPTELQPKFGNDKDIYASIQNLSDNFIKELQQNFPATIYTVIRTADKLAHGERKVEESCKLCLAPRDNVTRNEGLTALNAVEFSKTASQKSGEMVANDRFERLELDREEDDLKLCHACTKTYNEIKPKNLKL